MAKPEKEDQAREAVRQQTEALVPPYEGRQTSGKPVPSDGSVRHRTADELPNRGTAAPAEDEEQPASESTSTTSDYEGTGPSHMPGTTKGNETALGKDEEKLRKEREEASIMPSKPIDPEMP